MRKHIIFTCERSPSVWPHTNSHLSQQKTIKVKKFGISLVFIIINRTFCGRLDIRNFSSHVEKYFNCCTHGLNIFQRSLRNFISPRGRVISFVYAHLVFLPLYRKHFFYQNLFQNLRCILYKESFVSGAIVDPVLY